MCNSIALVFGSVFAWVGYQLGALKVSLGRLWSIATQDLEQNFYGMSTGFAEDDPALLTSWLDHQLEEIAHPAGDSGSLPEVPLTFGDLIGTARADNPNEEQISLRMVASNLSQHQPVILPYGLEGFLFKKSEMRQFFSARIVDHLCTKSAMPREYAGLLPDDFFFLPAARDLPVIVATRLSLSFPILLSAVPLYSVAQEVDVDIRHGAWRGERLNASKHLQRNWLSDGGICSNFPIHFFDAWLPQHPTFGINLTTFPPQAFEPESEILTPKCISPSVNAVDAQPSGIADEARQPIVLPEAESTVSALHWTIDSPVEFCQAILSTGLDYHDTMQSQLPSYRERIVQIRLNKNEGGLNLKLTRNRMDILAKKGRAAGAILSLKDDGTRHFNFEHHWWVRFRVLMAQLETGFEELTEGLCQADWFPCCLEDGYMASHKYPYHTELADINAWSNETRLRIDKLQDVIRRWQNQNTPHFNMGAPGPDAVLRVVPKF
jgi:hypothetical protein